MSLQCFESVTFIKEDTVGGVESHTDEHHMKMVQKKDKIEVPCYSLEDVLGEIKIYHIDFLSLDVEGAEMAVLERWTGIKQLYDGCVVYRVPCLGRKTS